jgi:hypothetical protein
VGHPSHRNDRYRTNRFADRSKSHQLLRAGYKDGFGLGRHVDFAQRMTAFTASVVTANGRSGKPRLAGLDRDATVPSSKSSPESGQ